MNKCYMCNGDLNEENKCCKCGAERKISQVSGNIIWVRNGRVVAAFQDEKDQFLKVAERYNIPPEQWPERFR